MAASDRSRRLRSEFGSATMSALLVAVLVVPLAVMAFTHRPGSGTQGSRPTAMPTPTQESASLPSSTPKGAAVTSNRALFFGDSYFIGGGYTDKRHSMAFLASKRLGLSPRITGGGGTGFVAANPAYDLPPYLGQIAAGALRARNPGWVVVEGGLNDRSAAPAQIRKNARQVLRIADRKHPQATVVLVGPVDTDGQYDDTRPVVRALRRAADVQEISFVNAQRWLRGRYHLIGPDYVHPTPAGHRLLARKLAKALRERGA